MRYVFKILITRGTLVICFYFIFMDVLIGFVLSLYLYISFCVEQLKLYKKQINYPLQCFARDFPSLQYYQHYIITSLSGVKLKRIEHRKYD